jgi:hypothetical protein
MSMEDRIAKVLDALVPRGGKKLFSLQIHLEEYLSRLANPNRKLQGTKYRMECWQRVCEEHKRRFKELAKSKRRLKAPEPSGTITSAFTLRDIRLENEFEMLLCSISSSLNALTRMVACYLKGASDLHGRSKLAAALSKQKGFKRMQVIAARASESWANEMRDRRDAATHYVALSLKSTIVRSKSGSDPTRRNVSQVGIPQEPLRYVSLWEDDLPTLGGSFQKSSVTETAGSKIEIHELLDSDHRIVIRRESPLPTSPKLIDGDKYVQSTYASYQKYVHSLLKSLTRKARGNSS